MRSMDASTSVTDAGVTGSAPSRNSPSSVSPACAIDSRRGKSDEAACAFDRVHKTKDVVKRRLVAGIAFETH